MSKTITFEVADDIYDACACIAARDGRPTEAVVLEWLAKFAPKPRPQWSEEELEAARERLRRHAGAANSGDPRSADNDRIDEDLAREYGSTHDEEEECFLIRQDCSVTSTSAILVIPSDGSTFRTGRFRPAAQALINC